MTTIVLALLVAIAAGMLTGLIMAWLQIRRIRRRNERLEDLRLRAMANLTRQYRGRWHDS